MGLMVVDHYTNRSVGLVAWAPSQSAVAVAVVLHLELAEPEELVRPHQLSVPMLRQIQVAAVAVAVARKTVERVPLVEMLDLEKSLLDGGQSKWKKYLR
jgi:hypothetical protein